MLRRSILWFLLIFSFAAADTSAQQARKKRKKFGVDDSTFRARLKAAADSIQRVKAASAGSMPEINNEITVQETEEQTPKSNDTDWLLPVAGVAVLATAYFLVRRRKS